MQVDAAIIGGTGIGDRLMKLGGKPLHVPTAAGLMRGRLVHLEGRTVFLASRHSVGHKVPPHKVNYSALALGLKALGVQFCLSTAAVGSLRADWGRGSLAVPSDFLDVTARNLTLFERQVVHTDFSDAFAPRARRAILDGAKACGVQAHDGGIYVCGNGPRYETLFEIDLYKKVGGDVVGMTAATEAIVMREAGVPYACLCVVTNLAAGMEAEALDHQDVVREMERAGEQAVAVLRAAIAGIDP